MAKADYNRLVYKLVKERKPVLPFDKEVIPVFEDKNEEGAQLQYIIAIGITMPYMRKAAHHMAPVSAVDAASLKRPAFGTLAGRAMADANKNLHFATIVFSMLRESRRLMDFMCEHELYAFALDSSGELAFDFSEKETTLVQQLQSYDVEELRKTIPVGKHNHVVVRDRGLSISNALSAVYSEASQLNCTRHGAEDLGKRHVSGRRARSAYHEVTQLRQGQRLQGEDIMQALREEDESAYDLLDAVPRAQLAACFLPDGVYAFGVRTSNWIEILWEALRKIGLRKQPCFLHQVMFFCMYSVVRYRQLSVKAKGLRQLSGMNPTKEMSTALVTNAQYLMDRGCTVKQIWDPEKQHAMYSVKVPLRYVPADGAYKNGEVTDYLDSDEAGFRMPLQLLPKGIPIAELRRNNVKWKEYVVDPSTDYDSTKYEACTLCSCMGPTNSWATCPHAGLAHLMAKQARCRRCVPPLVPFIAFVQGTAASQ